MGAKRVINGVHVVPMGMANAFLIEGDDGLTLIDAGFPRKEAAVFQAIGGLGRSPDQLKHLIFTHGHPDHIGSAAAIVRETGAKTYMHSLDIPLAESGGPFRPMRPAPGPLRQVLCRLFFDPDERMEPVTIDQALSDGEIHVQFVRVTEFQFPLLFADAILNQKRLEHRAVCGDTTLKAEPL